MIHGKWYKGCEDLSILGREISDEDESSWHLVIEADGKKTAACSLSPYKDSFCIREVSGDGEDLELMLRMIGEKLSRLNKTTVYAKADTGIKGFGFEPFENDVLKAEKLTLPVYCKG